MSVERDYNDIWYDDNPFVAKYQCKCGRIRNHKGITCDFCHTVCAYIGDLNARYKGEIQNQLNRQKPFGDLSDEYYKSIWTSIQNDQTLRNYYNGSSFLYRNLPEITNRLCTECEFVINVERQPKKYIGYTAEDCLPDILKYLDWALNVCRYGTLTVEKMIDTVEQDKIDEFLSLFSYTCAINLAIYIINHQSD